VAISGAPLPAPATEPLGRALRGLGVTREPLVVRLTPAAHGSDTEEQVIYSAARLWLGVPIGLVTGRIYRRFPEEFPRS
jgi:hypothetical protein